MYIYIYIYTRYVYIYIYPRYISRGSWPLFVSEATRPEVLYTACSLQILYRRRHRHHEKGCLLAVIHVHINVLSERFGCCRRGGTPLRTRGHLETIPGKKNRVHSFSWEGDQHVGCRVAVGHPHALRNCLASGVSFVYEWFDLYS